MADGGPHPVTLAQLAASEGWRIEHTAALRRLFARRRVKVALAHPTRRVLILESDRRRRLREHQTYVPRDGGEIRYLDGFAAVAHALHGTPPRGKTLKQRWQRHKRNASAKQ